MKKLDLNELDLTELLETAPVLPQSTKVEAGKLYIGYSKLPFCNQTPVTYSYEEKKKTLHIYLDQDSKFQVGSASGIEVIALPEAVEKVKVYRVTYPKPGGVFD